MKSKNNKNIKKAYVLAVDIGTTTIKVAIFDDKNKIITCESEKVILLYYTLYWYVYFFKIKVEILRKNDIFQAVIDPDKLWNQFVELVKKTGK